MSSPYLETGCPLAWQPPVTLGWLPSGQISATTALGLHIRATMPSFQVLMLT